jgi:uncharacterized protein
MDKKEIERRCLIAAELRVEDGDSPKITGYAAVFDTWTDIGGMFREKVAPGAFKKSLKEADVRALWNHDPNYVLGRNKAGTLNMKEDDKGLRVEIDPVDSSWSRDLLKSMSRGDVNQMSFGFIVNAADDDYEESTRVLRDVSLFDVSVVTYPAYPTTTAQVRSAFQKEETEEVSEPDPMDDIIARLKSKENLTEEHREIVKQYLPSEPVENHSEAEPEPVEYHSDADTRKVSTTKMLLAEAELLAPSKP